MGLTEVTEASLRLKKKTMQNVVKQIVHWGHLEIAKSSADRAAVTEVREYSGTIYYSLLLSEPLSSHNHQ